MSNIVYLIPLFGILGLGVMALKSAWVMRQNDGNESMKEIAGYIARGAMTFLKAEWKILSYYALVAGLLLA